MERGDSHNGAWMVVGLAAIGQEGVCWFAGCGKEGGQPGSAGRGDPGWRCAWIWVKVRPGGEARGRISPEWGKARQIGGAVAAAWGLPWLLVALAAGECHREDLWPWVQGDRPGEDGAASWGVGGCVGRRRWRLDLGFNLRVLFRIS